MNLFLVELLEENMRIALLVHHRSSMILGEPIIDLHVCHRCSVVHSHWNYRYPIPWGVLEFSGLTRPNINKGIFFNTSIKFKGIGILYLFAIIMCHTNLIY